MVPLIALCASLALAADETGPYWGRTPGDRTVTLVVSGGVSLGAYLAGELFALTEAIKYGAGDAPPTVVITGASAGSVGALLMGLELLTRGTTPLARPESSFFFRLWTPFGISPDEASLFRLDQPGQGSLFNDAYAEEVMGALPRIVRNTAAQTSEEEGAPEVAPWKGEVFLGMQTTRLHPVPLGPASTLDEAFVFQLVEQEGKVRGIPIRSTGERRDDLPTPLKEVARIARISGSFPGAFAFPSMGCETYDQLAFVQGRPCNVQQTYPDEIVMFDGGLYENNPVGLANDISSALNRTSPILYLDPSLDRTPADDPSQPCFGDASPTLLASDSPLLEMASSVASTFQVQGLAYQLRYHPEREILPLCDTTSPSSVFFASFLGFFDRSFRAADFYLGMYDGFRFVDAHPELFLDPSRPAPDGPLGRELELHIEGIYGLFRSALDSPQAQAIRTRQLKVDRVEARRVAEEIVRERMPVWRDADLYEPIVRVKTLSGRRDPWGADGIDAEEVSARATQMRINLAILLKESLARALTNDPSVTLRELEGSNIAASGTGFYSFLQAVDPAMPARDLGLEDLCEGSVLEGPCEVRFRPLDLDEVGAPSTFAEAFLRVSRNIGLSSVGLVEAQGAGSSLAEYAVRSVVGKRGKTFAVLGTGAEWNRLGLLSNFYPQETTGGWAELSASAWIRYGLGGGFSLKGTAGAHVDVKPETRTVFGHKGLMVVPRVTAEVEALAPALDHIREGLYLSPGLEVAAYPTSIFMLGLGVSPWTISLDQGFPVTPRTGFGAEMFLGAALPCLPFARENGRLCR